MAVSSAALLRVLPLELWPTVAAHQCIKADLRDSGNDLFDGELCGLSILNDHVIFFHFDSLNSAHAVNDNGYVKLCTVVTIIVALATMTIYHHHAFRRQHKVWSLDSKKQETTLAKTFRKAGFIQSCRESERMR